MEGLKHVSLKTFNVFKSQRISDSEIISADVSSSGLDQRCTLPKSLKIALIQLLSERKIIFSEWQNQR